VPAFPAELAEATCDIPADDRWTVRLRRLTTVDAARAGVLVELLGGLVVAEDRQAAVAKMTPERLAQADAAVSRLLCEVVESGSMDGGPFEPLRLVPDRKQHDPDATPPRLWVGIVPAVKRGALVGAAMVLHAEAEGILRPFRREPRASAPAAQAGPELRGAPDGAGGAHA